MGGISDEVCVHTGASCARTAGSVSVGAIAVLGEQELQVLCLVYSITRFRALRQWVGAGGMAGMNSTACCWHRLWHKCSGPS